MNHEKCFAFLRFALGDDASLPAALSGAEWHALFTFGQQQALLGILYRGIEHLPAGVAPPQSLLLQWVVVAREVRRQNIALNTLAGEMYRQFTADGFRCCLLKGQGNALLYDDPHARQAGDVDLWLCGYRAAADEEGAYVYPSFAAMSRKVIPYVQQHFTLDKIRGHHAMLTVGDKEVEAHFRPSERAVPIYNKRYVQWFSEQREQQCAHLVALPDDAGSVAIPTLSFNVVYHLIHLFHHFFDMGIGMRQMVDYWYVLRRYATLPAAEQQLLQQTIRHLGLYSFAAAVMWVLEQTLHLPAAWHVAAPDAWRGKLLLAEITSGGNFGQYDTKYGGITHKNIGGKYFTKTYRNLSFLPYYPAEAFCEPFYRTYHFFLRKAKGW